MELREGIEIKNALPLGKHSILKKANVNVKTSDGNVIHGTINLGFESRVSDVFVRSENAFIVLFDATVQGESAGKVLVLNKDYIVWVEPEDTSD